MSSESPAIERLHALVRKGYRPDFGAAPGESAVRLRHLGRAPDLLLRGDGTVEELGGRIPRHKRLVQGPGSIAAEKDSDQLRFMTFLSTVQKPSLRDRTRPFRRKYLYAPAAGIAFLGACFSFTAILANL